MVKEIFKIINKLKKNVLSVNYDLIKNVAKQQHTKRFFFFDQIVNISLV